MTTGSTSEQETLWHRVRRLARASELGLVLAAAVVGVLSGLVVVAMSSAMQGLHVLIFGIDPHGHLSIATGLPAMLVLLAPALGGLAFGLVSALLRRRGFGQPVDPIEANALHGGRMSLKDSLIVGAQTIASSGVGASVGLEAGYTQAASGVASRLGQIFHLRRADLRLMVGCGAGAAIGAAFNAPLMGAFYGFELILGTYAIPAFVPMMTASFTATLTRQTLLPDMPPPLPALGAPQMSDLPAILLLGILCALIGIVIMRGVTLVEAGFRRSALPAALRPMIGGLIVGALALWSPAVLSAGHGAVYYYIGADATLTFLLILLGAKVIASAVSIGAGFRGGLFFASVLMGVLAGRAYAAGLDLFVPGVAESHALYALIGMSALAVAVVGGPMTMTLLALEMTDDLTLTLAVLAAAAAASLITRRLFGFSFTTWRFHLRGENIRGAHDVGWVRDLTVETMMRREVPQVSADMTIEEARRAYPPGSTSYLVATTPEGFYAGMVPPAALYEARESEEDAGAPPATVRALLRQVDDTLRPSMTIRKALSAFAHAEADALAVTTPERRIVGILSEAHAVKRYSDEMGRRLSELTGERLD
ncbi:chloride channel protein [Ancylobacter mangrovi]|uniref:chloride channel protein n=1 Tax=Ancylobacter mangrovi TaxID=2972472 RepID=UPI0021632662|nr:chloride channel protein [Ancylobacter mangrovi]MCS0501191.1 chloride channel protein [Ancylobacter mangrovi]